MHGCGNEAAVVTCYTVCYVDSYLCFYIDMLLLIAIVSSYNHIIVTASYYYYYYWGPECKPTYVPFAKYSLNQEVANCNCFQILYILPEIFGNLEIWNQENGYCVQVKSHNFHFNNEWLIYKHAGL